jgi:hypothetical protein
MRMVMPPQVSRKTRMGAAVPKASFYDVCKSGGKLDTRLDCQVMNGARCSQLSSTAARDFLRRRALKGITLTQPGDYRIEPRVPGIDDYLRLRFPA